MPDQPIIFWFRRNLRIADNPVLHAAARTGAPVIPVYVLDKNAGSAAGAASLWWLSRSLRSHGDLRKRGSRLILRKGEFGREI
jgi:deoxyribodipyrimidine photo-lyase